MLAQSQHELWGMPRWFANSHKGKTCGWAFRKGMRLWQLLNVRPLRQPVRIRIIKGTRRWTECIPM